MPDKFEDSKAVLDQLKKSGLKADLAASISDAVRRVAAKLHEWKNDAPNGAKCKDIVLAIDKLDSVCGDVNAKVEKTLASAAVYLKALRKASGVKKKRHWLEVTQAINEIAKRRPTIAKEEMAFNNDPGNFGKPLMDSRLKLRLQFNEVAKKLNQCFGMQCKNVNEMIALEDQRIRQLSATMKDRIRTASMGIEVENTDTGLELVSAPVAVERV